MDMLGIIFAEMYGEQLDSLTYDRSMAAVPFGGRYRMVDFVLSNLVNSGVTNVGVLAKQHYRSLMDHSAALCQRECKYQYGRQAGRAAQCPGSSGGQPGAVCSACGYRRSLQYGLSRRAALSS